MNSITKATHVAFALLFLSTAHFADAHATGGPAALSERIQPGIVTSNHVDAVPQVNGERPGPYALYLMHLGFDRDDALEQAKAIDRGQDAAVPRYADARP